jgi:hypothetical protein
MTMTTKSTMILTPMTVTEKGTVTGTGPIVMRIVIEPPRCS